VHGRAGGTGRRDSVSIAVLHAGGSASDVKVNADLQPGQPAASPISRKALISQKECPGGPGCERKAGAAMPDTLMFGGVCDRCGRLYLQRSFPRRCLCPSCVLGGATAIEPARLLGCIHLTGINLAAS
jgi:hypothetical protein